ncbi:MAG: hypothetical protein OQK04_16215, partial [Kangiellaceae bacterium]|nr:hypothetical protein [Kangiellaceae bacterium]
MKKITSVLLLFLSFGIYAEKQGNLAIEFKSNRVLGLYEFVMGISGKGYTSQTLVEIFQDSEFNDAEARKRLQLLSELNLGYSYELKSKAKYRHNSIQIRDIFVMAGARSKDLNDFSERTFGLLPNNDHKELIDALRYFEAAYLELIWEPSQKFLNKNLSDITKKATQLDMATKFKQVSDLYAAEWNFDISFEVYISPIPRSSGHSMATPQGNVLSMLVLDGQDLESQLSIVFHELVHILFINQNPDLQQSIEKWFLQSASSYKAKAYQIFDEAMATAIGNGWFYKYVFGKLDEQDWYYTPYVNRQAKSIYKLVENKLQTKGQLDAKFIEQFIGKYQHNFPGSHLEVENFLANTTFLCEQNSCPQEQIANVFFKHLKFLRSFNTIEPISSEEKQKEMSDSINTQIAVVNNRDQLKALS